MKKFYHFILYFVLLCAFLLFVGIGLQRIDQHINMCEKSALSKAKLEFNTEHYVIESRLNKQPDYCLVTLVNEDESLVVAYKVTWYEYDDGKKEYFATKILQSNDVRKFVNASKKGIKIIK